MIFDDDNMTDKRGPVAWPGDKRKSAEPIPAVKDPNPKDAMAGSKIPLHLWPTSASLLGCLALLDGMGKYGRTNYRATDVNASVYYAACLRHLGLWFEGQDIDEDSGLPHLAHAIACIAILIDAEMAGTLIDDRVYPGDYLTLVKAMAPMVDIIRARHAARTPKHYDKRDKP